MSVLYSVIGRLGGVAAVAGGLLWVVKGGGILLTGVQLPAVFEAATLLSAVGVLGLRARLGERAGPLGKAGTLVACVAALSAGVAVVAPLTPFIAAAGFGPFLGLVLLGSDVLRAEIFRSPWHALPLAMGLGGPLAILSGGILALFGERLLEVPIVLLGLAWVLLGYAVLAVEGATVRRPA
jgi:hypothetical protein